MCFNSKMCQSCGMPLSKDPKGGGTLADGSKTTEYCSHCYQNGRFTKPDLTAEQMVQLVRGKFKEMGVPRVVGWFFTRNIPKLGRWKNK